MVIVTFIIDLTINLSMLTNVNHKLTITNRIQSIQHGGVVMAMPAAFTWGVALSPCRSPPGLRMLRPSWGVDVNGDVLLRILKRMRDAVEDVSRPKVGGISAVGRG